MTTDREPKQYLRRMLAQIVATPTPLGAATATPDRSPTPKPTIAPAVNASATPEGTLPVPSATREPHLASPTPKPTVAPAVGVSATPGGSLPVETPTIERHQQPATHTPLPSAFEVRVPPQAPEATRTHTPIGATATRRPTDTPSPRPTETQAPVVPPTQVVPPTETAAATLTPPKVPAATEFPTPERTVQPTIAPTPPIVGGSGTIGGGPSAFESFIEKYSGFLVGGIVALGGLALARNRIAQVTRRTFVSLRREQ